MGLQRAAQQQVLALVETMVLAGHAASPVFSYSWSYQGVVLFALVLKKLILLVLHTLALTLEPIPLPCWSSGMWQVVYIRLVLWRERFVAGVQWGVAVVSLVWPFFSVDSFLLMVCLQALMAWFAWHHICTMLCCECACCLFKLQHLAGCTAQFWHSPRVF